MYNTGQDSYPPSAHEMKPYHPQSPNYPPGSPQYPPGSPQYPPTEGSAYPPTKGSIDYQPQRAPSYSVPAPIPAPQPMPAHTTNTSHTVIIQQPQQQVVMRNTAQTWSTDICDCCDDCGLCALGFLCPQILTCVVSVKAGECCCVGLVCPIALRASIRERYGIQGDICSDCYTLHYCGLCAFCQMGRELNIRAGKT